MNAPARAPSEGSRGGGGRRLLHFDFAVEVREAMSETESQTGGEGPGREGQEPAAASEYEERLTEFADLAARVRHEINNPLTGLIGQAQLLLREELSDTARRRVQTIEQLANRIRDTVAELRAVQRPNPNAPKEAEGPKPEAPPRH
jgi:signal transduction histidine kinase